MSKKNIRNNRKSTRPPGPAAPPAHLTPLQVIVEGNDDFAFYKAYKEFKSLVQRERIIGQIKQKMAFEKPSERKRRKRRESFERNLANDRRDRLIASGEWDKKKRNNNDEE